MKRISFIFFSLLFSASLFAQGNRMNIEQRYRTQKIAFITDKMQLTLEEAEKFWPLYKDLESKKEGFGKAMHEYRASFPEDETVLTEDQAVKLLDYFNKHSIEMYNLSIDYQKKFLNVISAKKLLLLNEAENEFRRHLLREFRGGNANGKVNKSESLK